MKIAKVSLVFVVMSLVCLVLNGDVLAQQKTIKLGAPIPTSTAIGQEMEKAMRLAVKEINQAGGVLGRPVDLIVVDDEMKPEKGAAAIEKLATLDKVDLFIGGMASGVHMAQIPILKKYKIVTVWLGAASHKCEEALEGSDWYFHLHTWDYEQGAQERRGWEEIHKKYPEIKIGKRFMAYEEGGFGAASFEANKEIWKGDYKITGEAFKSAQVGGGDYRALLRHAKEWNPDSFDWIGYEADAMPIMEQAKEIQFAPPVFLGAPPMWPPKFAKEALAQAVCFYGAWSASLKAPASMRFLDAYTKEYGRPPANYIGPLAYSNVYIAVEGIKRAGTLEKEALIRALESSRRRAHALRPLTPPYVRFRIRRFMVYVETSEPDPVVTRDQFDQRRFWERHSSCVLPQSSTRGHGH
jgi:branched-chain amino acid transport system substrate-binding protein